MTTTRPQSTLRVLSMNLEQIKQFCAAYGGYGNEPYSDSAFGEEEVNGEEIKKKIDERILWYKTAVEFRDDVKRRMDRLTTKEEIEAVLRDLPIVCRDLASVLTVTLLEDDEVKHELVGALLRMKGEEEKRSYEGQARVPAGTELEQKIDELKSRVGWQHLGIIEKQNRWAAFEQEVLSSPDIQMIVDDFVDQAAEVARSLVWMESYLKGQLKEIEMKKGK